MDDAFLTLYVIYDHPRDYPGHFVVRRNFIHEGRVYAETRCRLAATLAEARAALPIGVYNLGRHPDDDPAIAEVWV